MTRSDKLRKIKAVVLDVDGVLTDGRAGFGGENEIKFFHLRDGHWMKLAIRAGLKVGLLSGRGAKANRQRAGELGLSFCYENCKDKLEAFEKMLAEQGLSAEECLYMGDDVIDMPPMRRAGVGVVVADGRAGARRSRSLADGNAGRTRRRGGGDPDSSRRAG